MPSKRKFEEGSCPRCNDLDARNHEEATTDLDGRSMVSLEFPVSTINLDCPYCCLLRRVILDYLPDLETALRSPVVHLYLTEGSPASIEVTGREIQETEESASVGNLVTGVLFYLSAVGKASRPIIVTVKC